MFRWILGLAALLPLLVLPAIRDAHGQKSHSQQAQPQLERVLAGLHGGMALPVFLHSPTIPARSYGIGLWPGVRLETNLSPVLGIEAGLSYRWHRVGAIIGRPDIGYQEIHAPLFAKVRVAGHAESVLIGAGVAYFDQRSGTIQRTVGGQRDLEIPADDLEKGLSYLLKGEFRMLETTGSFLSLELGVELASRSLDVLSVEPFLALAIGVVIF